MIYLTINPAVAKSIFWKLKKEDLIKEANSLKEFLHSDSSLTLKSSKRFFLIQLLKDIRIIYKRRFL